DERVVLGRAPAALHVPDVKVTVAAHATVANLGPGFDCLGLALGLANDFVADTAGDPGAVTVRGQGAGDLPEDSTNLVVRAAERLAAAVGRELPPFALICRNRIPLERGLGSSAAAAMGGLVLAGALLRAAPAPGELLRL